MQAELKTAEHKAVAYSVTLASKQALAKRNARLLWGEEAPFTGVLVKKRIKVHLHSTSRCSYKVHDSSPLVTSKANGNL